MSEKNPKQTNEERISGYKDVKLRFTPPELDEALERIEEARRREEFDKFIGTVANNAANLDLEVELAPENIPKPKRPTEKIKEIAEEIGEVADHLEELAEEAQHAVDKHRQGQR